MIIRKLLTTCRTEVLGWKLVIVIGWLLLYACRKVGRLCSACLVGIRVKLDSYYNSLLQCSIIQTTVTTVWLILSMK